MSEKKVKLRPRRVFSESIKKARVKEYEKGEFSVKELCRLYGFSDKSLYNWIYKYSVYNKKNYRIVKSKDSGRKKLKQLEDKIAELERLVGQKQIKIDYLEEMIALAKEQYSLDLKENSNARQS